MFETRSLVPDVLTVRRMSPFHHQADKHVFYLCLSVRKTDPRTEVGEGSPSIGFTAVSYQLDGTEGVLKPGALVKSSNVILAKLMPLIIGSF